eukprot:683585_1
MPSKQKKGAQKNTNAPQERVPLQSNTNTDLEDSNDLNESAINTSSISIAPEWNTLNTQDPTAFDPNNDDPSSKSIFFDTNNDELLTGLFDGYSWCSISEYLNDHDKQTIKIASQLTVENAKDTGIVHFTCYDTISLSTELASIYQFVIQLIQSTNNSDVDPVYPWNLIYPQSKATGLPTPSGNGLYLIKLYFCGQWRAILIDDKVPMFEGKVLFPNIEDTNELWPQLLTKAILKLLILSNRLEQELSVPLIVQLLTANKVTTDVAHVNSSISYKYITKSVQETDEKSDEQWPVVLANIEEWNTQNVSNAFIASDTVDQQSQKCWAIMDCPSHDATQNVYDVWSNTKTFSNDMAVMIATSNEPNPDSVDVIVQIDCLDTNLSEKVQIFMYDQANNIKKAIQITQMAHGFASFVVRVVPSQIYLIQVDGNTSYSVTVYWDSQCSEVSIAPRFGDENIWNLIDYNMIEIASESKYLAASQAFVLFNIHLVVLSQQCHMIFHCVFDDESLSNSLVFYCVNLDNHCTKLIPNLNLSTLNLEPNQNGYSLVAFARPTQVIKSSKYEIKLLYKGDVKQNTIEMQSSLDFQIDYKQNYDVTLMKDEIICDSASNAEYIFMFCEVCFMTNGDDYGEFGKIIEFTNRDTGDIVAQYASTQSIVYVPQIMMTNQKPSKWFVIKLDKTNAGSNPKQLFEDNSVQCMVRIISNVSVRLFPDNSQQIQFDQIKQSWQVAKGRAEEASQSRQKYLQNRADTAAVTVEETQNKDAVVVNDEFWQKDGRIKNTLLQKSTRNIQNEQQFRASQSTEINDHNTYIQTVQNESFQNIQTFTSNDLKERGELRSERLEWNQILSEMNVLNNGMKVNFDNFKQILTTFHDELNTMIQESATAEPSKKGKSKAKTTKPSTNDMIFPLDISKLIEHCEKMEQNIPQWVYGDAITACNGEMYSILCEMYGQMNAQFAEFVNHIKTTLKGKENDVFSEYSEKYIELCSEILQQINTVIKWKASANWEAKLQDMQSKCESITIDSVFAKLQSIISMDEANGNPSKDDRTETENENENESSSMNLEMMKECLDAIPFASESKRNVIIKQRTIELNQNYTEYIQNIERLIQHNPE